MKSLNLYACQIDIAWEDPPANFAKISRLLARENVVPGSLIVLPEMFSTGFTMNVAEAVRYSDEAERFLQSLAVEKKATVLAGVATQGAGEGKGRNEAVAFGPDGSCLSRYRKNRTFRYSGECRHFERGSDLSHFDGEGFRMCPLICYDLRFPELFRRGVADGAQVFVVIANWPSPRKEHWEVLLRARAIENQAWVVGVNRCGSDPREFYSGHSLIVDPLGKIVARAGEGECCLVTRLNLKILLEWRAEFPALEDLDA